MTDHSTIVERLRRIPRIHPSDKEMATIREAADTIETLSSDGRSPLTWQEVDALHSRIAELETAQADADQRVKAAVEAERERCAKIAKAACHRHRYSSDPPSSVAYDIATAIRAGREESHG